MFNLTKIFKKKPKRKPPEPLCGNCLLYDNTRGICRVSILHEGEKFNLPVIPTDHCFFEDKFEATNPEGKKEEFKSPEIQQIRFFVEDAKTGEPTSSKGVVKVEYPVWEDRTKEAPPDTINIK